MKKVLTLALGICLSLTVVTSGNYAMAATTHTVTVLKHDGDKGDKEKKDKKKECCKEKKNCTTADKEKCKGNKGACCHGHGDEKH